MPYEGVVSDNSGRVEATIDVIEQEGAIADELEVKSHPLNKITREKYIVVPLTSKYPSIEIWCPYKCGPEKQLGLI
ncbi:unnamed protein product [Arabidopsis lyrata]|uniref:Predicted protein n=1 Tax=Arabidopsis lyrata subsp. lyrata TaxID=81972 RepID=D7LJ07_ARALL|nr:predicted protein [Arabidopsis lyrata subsp. lyrata]CAH8263921.1 unnamed protein product [Arabidopsis lyrata]